MTGYVYVAQSASLSRSMKEVRASGYLVKLGMTEDMSVRLEGLCGRIDGTKAAKYGGKADWRFWRYRVATHRTADWYCDHRRVEDWLKAEFRNYNIQQMPEVARWAKDQDWAEVARQELFLVPSPKLLEPLFPYRAANLVPQVAIGELEAIPEAPPRPKPRAILDDWRESKSFGRTPRINE